MPSRCPVVGPVAPSKARHTAAGSLSNADWWPDQLNLRILKAHAGAPPPLGFDFKYTAAFNELDFQALKNDLLYPKSMDEVHIIVKNIFVTNF